MSDPVVIRVANVRNLRTREGGRCVVYCGRRCNGWAQSEWHNPFRVGDVSPNNHRVTIDREHALELFRAYLDSMEEAHTLGGYLARLWEACERGTKPLGCWCCDVSIGDGSPVVCHAQILGALLVERFVKKEAA